MLELVAGTHFEGYSHCLMKVFDKNQLPTKSALCHARKRISYRFFSDYLFSMLKSHKARLPLFKGLHVFAIDGCSLTLPRTKKLTQVGFTGRSVSSYSESWMLKGYLTLCHNVLSGTTHDLHFSSGSDEISDAKDMVLKLPKNSVALYDRLFICKKLILAHHNAQNYFLMRVRRNSFTWIQAFLESSIKKKQTTFLGAHLTLIKVRCDGKAFAYLTNLPSSFVSEKQISRLYQRRWEVETSFKDLVSTMKLEQWHSKSLNGVLQELYATLILYNIAKLSILPYVPKPKKRLPDEYEKPNFKLILNYIKAHIKKIIQGKQAFLKNIKKLIKHSTEKRIHLKRTYPRQIRSPLSPYKYNNVLLAWEA